MGNDYKVSKMFNWQILYNRFVSITYPRAEVRGLGKI